MDKIHIFTDSAQEIWTKARSTVFGVLKDNNEMKISYTLHLLFHCVNLLNLDFREEMIYQYYSS